MRNGQLGAYRARKAYELYKMTFKERTTIPSSKTCQKIRYCLDGLYMMGVDSTHIHLFKLTTAYVPSTAQYVSSAAHGMYDFGAGLSFAVSNDGLKVIIINNSTGTPQYFVIYAPGSLAGFHKIGDSGPSFNVTGGYNKYPWGIELSNNGMECWIMCLKNGTQTPSLMRFADMNGHMTVIFGAVWVCSSAELIVPLASSNMTVACIDFTIDKVNGKHVYFLDGSGTKIHKYSCKTAFDFGNLFYDTTYKLDATVNSIDIASDGKSVICGFTYSGSKNSIYRYTLV